MDSLQRRTQRTGQVRAQPFGEQPGLIEPALTLPCRMERNGNDRVESALTKTLVIERRHQPARDQMPKIDLSAVFKIENDVANNPAAAKSRNRSVEMER